MQKQQFSRSTEAVHTAPSACPLPPLVQPNLPTDHRKLRVALPTLPRRQPRLADRHIRAAERAAELAFWQVTGGDYLRSSV